MSKVKENCVCGAIFDADLSFSDDVMAAVKQFRLDHQVCRNAAATALISSAKPTIYPASEDEKVKFV